MATGIGGEIVWICPSLSSTSGVDDLSGNGNNGTLVDASIVFDPSNSGNYAIDFQAESHRVEIGRPAEVVASPNDFSISAWVYPTTSGSARTIWGGYNGLHNNSLWSLLRIDSGNLKYWYSNTQASYRSITGPSVSLNTWTHVVVTIDSNNNIKFYLNGSQSGSTQTLETPSSAPAFHVEWYIGQSQQGLVNQYDEVFDGKIDDFRWFDRTLADHEVISLSAKRGYEPSNGIGDEAIWLCPSIDDTATDLSPASNTVTYNGSLTVVNDVSNGGTKAYDGTTGTSDTVTVDWPNSSITSRSMSLWCKPIGFQQFTNNDVVKGQLQFGEPGNTVAFSATLTAPPWSEKYEAGTPAGVYNDTWHHFAMVQDTTNTLVYVDGTLYATYSTASNIQYGSGNQTFTLAEDDCYIDDFRVFNRKLTSSEITSLASRRGYTSGGGGGGGEGEGGNLTFHPFNSTHVLD